MNGTLYVCGTPLGNLEDITFRALRVLREADFIAAEDTRHTLKLLNHYEISAPLISCHEHNEKIAGEKIIGLLKNGKNVALVTDAGMPGISDPGAQLVKLCHDNGITVTAAPGPTALTTGLALSGLVGSKFIFEGFPPADKKSRLEAFGTLSRERRPVIFYEAPHHLVRTLTDLLKAVGSRNVTLARELTKKFEEIQRGSLEELLEYFKLTPPKGEYVIIVEGISKEEESENKKKQWEEITVHQHVETYEKSGLSRKDALKAVAKDRGVPKSVVYKEMLTTGKEG